MRWAPASNSISPYYIFEISITYKLLLKSLEDWFVPDCHRDSTDFIPAAHYRSRMRSPGRTIAIIGAGFSGTLLAVNLLRRASDEALRIVLIESRAEVGRGVAYRRDDRANLLNVPAARMSADSRDPMQFARFAKARDARCGADDYLPRQLYGEYLQALLLDACDAAPPSARFERIHARAESIFRIDLKGPYLVSLSNQQRLLADDVVLACGDPPPTTAASAAAIEQHRAYVRDPFGDRTLRADAQTLLLIGTGLTMADVAIAAASLNPNLRIHALSRHGLLPAQQVSSAHAAVSGEFLSRLSAAAPTARSLVRAFRALQSDLEAAAKGDWRDAVNVARQAAPDLWRRMPLSERARFLRHVRVHWDIHRHRMPPSVASQLNALRRSGRLQIHAGHLLPMSAQGERIAVKWRERGSQGLRSLLVDQVVNCSGAHGRLKQTRDGLLAGLVAGGLAVPDALGLGLTTGPAGALIDSEGRVARHLYYVGPMLRARHWEATAVGELRGYVESLAQALVPLNSSESTPLIAPSRRLDQFAFE
jgi:uncharacterized NAD(P)/FAD-binding protein YdhS